MKKKRNARNEFLALIPHKTKKVLDFGCGSGDLCAGLIKNNVEVIGVENNEQLGNKAQEKLTKVFIADAEKFKLPYPDGYFDCIVCADVLEHFIDPLIFLKEHSKYLADDGLIIASIPNVRYYKIITRLILGGTWDYVEAGILDKSHLRFFTLLNIQELFCKAGYHVIKVERNIVAATGFRLLNFICFNLLREFLCYQYYIVAEKTKNGGEYINTRKIYQF